jgi:hypothetical protein
VQIRRRADPKQISALPEKFLPVHHLHGPSRWATRGVLSDGSRLPAREISQKCMQILKMNRGDAETTQKRCTVTEDYEY